ncbi:hypothetical protein EN866_02730 [Mesorhizobium sp. M2D.F.Ca.ET.223.01.1.1]|uniref:hypothetical protein n=1 Tax=unclassified Mesorhizobium TaxID=325217 RepID=UPI000FCA5995|nr:MULTISPECIES: hypothetical protein [unclassified Mesorhizobium]TGQ00897.1 hypothetical protein EN864_02730 [bacterium M00.F.Ca.ET.221.01.1.1]TGQ02584.1 hypothetical protein EN865_01175 [bacterium M00.F.Ca.ET.222.01.1.1]TGU12476.1 hypothetical protein EN806_18935 [bacterium M00.F.Ca.ET.163.01.1.1]TGV71868.1 hypothetical protein EN792_063735 [Mesorhizobium sp. M00.F.Ca.ET.149.01.1.1]TGV72195.1 hypothetical protein EN803_01165 [Mesorhizobium sp. M2D.F.Ca.ET.160.01.1.1]
MLIDELEGQVLHITTNWNAAATANTTPARTPTSESTRLRSDVDAARNTALSALNNDRFRAMLEQISDPGTSGALATMSSDSQNVVDFNTALSRYAESSE